MTSSHHPGPAGQLDLDDARRLAESHGLRALGERPPFVRYLRDLWQRRSFLYSLASGQSASQFQNNRLGQLWAVLNPALLILSYFLIFGLLLGTRGGVTNYIGFLSIGVILFSFMSSNLTRGANVMNNNIGLIRALRFPRALLPMSVTLSELIVSLPAFGLLIIVMLVTGEPPAISWLLFPVAVVIAGITMLGIVLILARLVNISRDIANVIPITIRLLRYVSGVFFSIEHYASGVAGVILGYQPFALMLTTARESLMQEYPVDWTHWVAAAIWAIVLIVVGMIVFWRDEARYGRG